MNFNVVYASDEGFSKYAAISILSLLKYNPEVNIYFLDAGISNIFKKELMILVESNSNKAVLKFINVKAYLDTLKDTLPSLENSYATYARLYIEKLLPANVNSCIYLDCDTLINGDLKNIFFYNNLFPVYMCYDIVSRNHKRQIGFNINEPYYNAGVILINLGLWRKGNYSNQITTLLTQKHNFRFHDQDILNIIFKDHIGILPFCFNVQTQFFYFYYQKVVRMAYCLPRNCFYEKKDFSLSDTDIKIYHLTSVPFMIRPWYRNSNHLCKKLFDTYVQKTPWKNFFYRCELNLSLRQKLIKRLYELLPHRVSSCIIGIMHLIFNLLYKY